MEHEEKLLEYEKAYEKMREYGEQMHVKNEKRISIGIICIIVIPVVFLVLLFTMNSSKIVFLVFWIVSLFVISGYLITIEYRDYTMQQKLQELGIKKEEEIDELIGSRVLGEKLGRISEMAGKLKNCEIKYSEDDRKNVEESKVSEENEGSKGQMEAIKEEE